MQTGNYDAEYGRAGGAVVNTITRSGTNTYHGTAGYLIESTRFDAITTIQALDPAVQQRGHPLPGTDQWFSGTFGGKIIRDRTFFFGSYQEERQNSSSQVALVTLSPAGRATLNRVFPAGTNSNVDLYNKITGAVNATGTVLSGRPGSRQRLGRIRHRSLRLPSDTSGPVHVRPAGSPDQR